MPGLPEWNDVLSELDVWAYFRPSLESRHLLVAAVSGVGGWHGRVPFQLTLGGDAGLRGYPRHVDPGGRRLVGSLEYRAKPAWPAPTLFDAGTVLFLDIGKIWRGHAPFGTTSPVRLSAGVGLRAAFPPGSRQTLRLDIGVPIERHAQLNDLVFSIGIGQSVGRGSMRRDPQLVRSTRYSLNNIDFINP
jgi:outer membrane protein assembly factor BamA